MKVTIKEIAERAGVSKATVSRVLNNSKPVSNDIRVRVMAVVEATGFKPNAVARSLSMKKSHLIGIIIPDLSNPVFSKIIQGIEAKLRETAYSLVIAATDFEASKKREHIEVFKDRGIDGLILITDDGDNTLEMLADFDKPVVMIGTGQMSDEIPVVKIDNYAAAKAMTEKLLSLGHTSIAMIRGPLTDIQSGRERFRGYRDVLQLHGCYDEALVFSGMYTFENGYEAMEKLMKDERPVSAVFCANDLMAVGAMRFAVEKGFRIPEEIAFAGFDDVDIACMMTPSLTTIRQPFAMKGETAIKVLFELIEGSEKLDKMVYELPFELIERESTSKI